MADSIGRSSWGVNALRIACFAMLLGLATNSTSRPEPQQGSDYYPCLENCLPACGNNNFSCTQECYDTCRRTTGGAAAPAKPAPRTPARPNVVSWGAIAFSAADGMSGTSMAKISQAAAEQEAMAKCSQRGKACAVVSSFNKECGALARAGRVYSTAVSADQPAAMQKAVQQCTTKAGARCTIQILFCSR